MTNVNNVYFILFLGIFILTHAQETGDLCGDKICEEDEFCVPSILCIRGLCNPPTCVKLPTTTETTTGSGVWCGNIQCQADEYCVTPRCVVGYSCPPPTCYKS